MFKLSRRLAFVPSRTCLSTSRLSATTLAARYTCPNSRTFSSSSRLRENDTKKDIDEEEDRKAWERMVAEKKSAQDRMWARAAASRRNREKLKNRQYDIEGDKAKMVQVFMSEGYSRAQAEKKMQRVIQIASYSAARTMYAMLIATAVLIICLGWKVLRLIFVGNGEEDLRSSYRQVEDPNRSDRYAE
ncbi:hypothetical protein ONS96_011396 [Cadophora gregata f. sp. sojae]|nr:hypothetical protein ONS96_011396 [Cadophora gregata f. sp. sojae]